RVLHQVQAMIGERFPCGGVLRGRRWTGEVCTPARHAARPSRDWILSRILRLGGCEPGRNRLVQVDTFRRYIYTHRTPECELMREPRARGCVRMRNRDLVELFPRVPPHCAVRIDEAPCPQWAGAPPLEENP